MDILKAALSGEELNFNSPDFEIINQLAAKNTELQKQLNTNKFTEKETRKIISEIIQQSVDENNQIMVPFYTDFGSHIFLGKDIFINRNATMVDLGGIYIEDGVLIGPNVTITTVNHQEDPNQRRNVIGAAVHLKKHSWIGAGAIILPGVTIGENAIVGAGSIVTKDVPKDTIVVGNPAKVLRKIRRNS